MQKPLQVHIWNHEVYWGCYKCIEDNASNKAIGIEAEIKVDVRGWGTQWPEGLIGPDRELKLDK